MKISTESFYKELEGITNEIISFTEQNFKTLSTEKLLKKTSPDKWSIGECLQHLVKYGEFYLNAMETQLAKERNSEPTVIYKTGYFGNKFAEMLRYKEQGMKKMKAPKIESLYFTTVQENIVDIFLARQNKLLELLAKTKHLNLAKVKVPIALTRLIKTKIGDTLRFTIYHNQRHFIQAKKVLEAIQ